MSWFPRMIPRNPLSFGTAELVAAEGVAAAGQDVERQRQADVERGLPEGVVDRVVVVGDLWDPGHHHPAQPQGGDGLELGDALLGRPHGRLPQPDQPVRCMPRIGGDPAVVGVETGLLVVPVGVVAQQHPDRWVEDLGTHAVAVLLVEAHDRVPAAGVQLVPPDVDMGADHRGVAARGGDHPVGHPAAPVVDDHHRAHRVVVGGDGRPVAVRRIDVGGVAVVGLGDVRVGRDGLEGHAGTSWSSISGWKVCTMRRMPSRQCTLVGPISSCMRVLSVVTLSRVPSVEANVASLPTSAAR